MATLAKPRRNSDIVERRIADETFLLPVKGDLATKAAMFVLSEVGQFLWTRIDGQRTVDSLVADVVGTFDVTHEQAAADIVEFLEQLHDHGLIQEEPA